MLHPSMTDLLEKVDNRYLLVNVAAKRAREIAEEAEINEVRLNEKPVKLALDDIADGKIVNTTQVEIPQGAGASIEE
jgi:DNA-directed RNA polymerase omega subunit